MRLSRVLSEKYGAALASLADVVAPQKISLLGDDSVTDTQLLPLALAAARRLHVRIEYRGPDGAVTLVSRREPLRPGWFEITLDGVEATQFLAPVVSVGSDEEVHPRKS